ncbi:MAG: hypothetical protein KDB40_11055 [Acidimicrobiales bacterium]|nr:hypothetical protein [Acidimicrobiales bacterium]MCB9393817.1 hypothetical protein [Acidimicrobiaceae bacterium]
MATKRTTTTRNSVKRIVPPHPCLSCGAITTRPQRCEPCYKAQQRARNARRGDRYGKEYVARRAEIEKVVEVYGFRCWRCLRYEAPGTFTRDDWHTDHAPWGELRPTHRKCNTSASRGGKGEQWTPPSDRTNDRIR